MSNLIIIGASALGRETYAHARACGLAVKGFLDSRTGLLDRFPGYPPILSSAEEYSVSKEDVFVCAVGDPDERRHYVEMVAAKGGRFVSVVHPSAVLGMNASIGAGCIIQPFAVVGNDASIGQHALIGPQSRTTARRATTQRCRPVAMSPDGAILGKACSSAYTAR